MQKANLFHIPDAALTSWEMLYFSVKQIGKTEAWFHAIKMQEVNRCRTFLRKRHKGIRLRCCNIRNLETEGEIVIVEASSLVFRRGTTEALPKSLPQNGMFFRSCFRYFDFLIYAASKA
jgi:hypothetical protein